MIIPYCCYFFPRIIPAPATGSSFRSQQAPHPDFGALPYFVAPRDVSDSFCIFLPHPWNQPLLSGALILSIGEWHLETKVWVGELIFTGCHCFLGPRWTEELGNHVCPLSRAFIHSCICFCVYLIQWFPTGGYFVPHLHPRGYLVMSTDILRYHSSRGGLLESNGYRLGTLPNIPQSTGTNNKESSSPKCQ